MIPNAFSGQGPASVSNIELTERFESGSADDMATQEAFSNTRVNMNIVARHPEWPARTISLGFGSKPEASWSAGDQRKTPLGTTLPGKRDCTCGSFSRDHEDENVT